MKITKIKIKNLFGIKETELDGRSVEFLGKNGTGKSSIIDSIRLALTNNSNRDLIVRQGEEEGEVLIETDTSLSILRKKRSNQSDYKSVKQDNKVVMSPEKYLSEIFTPLQLNPIEFTQMSKQEQNKVILNLIEFSWDMKYIEDKFAEIPRGVNYDQHILKVLEEIQSDKGGFYQKRQEINREIRYKMDACSKISQTLPTKYNADKWGNFPFADKYELLNNNKDMNSKIERAKTYATAYNARLTEAKANRDSAIQLEKDLIADEKTELVKRIARLKAEITASEEKILKLDDKILDKTKIAEVEYSSAIEKIKSNNKIAEEYSSKTVVDTLELEEEINLAQEMAKHLNEYTRMKTQQAEIEEWREQADKLTEKIELARTLPSEILKTAIIPLDNLTVENGVPLIDGLPISNLSTGEQLDLCIDVALSKPGNLKILLIDEISVLDSESRQHIYDKCKANGLQFIATRPSDSEELEVIYL